MATNPYFKKDYSGEQDVLEDLTVELIKTMGRDMYYIPRNILDMDMLFGEGLQVNYKNGIPLEMYIDSVSGFDGQGDIASKFGIEVKDSIMLTLSKKRFKEEVQTRFVSITRPREGDLIYFPLAKAIFEINFVEHENPFYQFGKLFSYKLTCELFTYNQEEVTTGTTEIDNVVSENQEVITRLTLIPTVSGQTQGFYIGEKIYQVSGVTGSGATLSNATFTAYIASPGTTGLAYISATTGSVLNSASLLHTIRGDSSNLEFYVISKQAGVTLAIVNDEDRSLQGDNADISLESKIKGLINYTESDPFSQGNY
jgi:hypothetical protein